MRPTNDANSSGGWGSRRQAEQTGIAADLVQRDEAVVHIERGVLHALGHYRRRHLLELADEAALLSPFLLTERRRVLQEQNIADEIEQSGVDGRVAPPG